MTIYVRHAMGSPTEPLGRKGRDEFANATVWTPSDRLSKCHKNAVGLLTQRVNGLPDHTQCGSSESLGGITTVPTTAG